MADLAGLSPERRQMVADLQAIYPQITTGNAIAILRTSNWSLEVRLHQEQKGLSTIALIFLCFLPVGGSGRS
jgi:hypothetical protein